MAVEIRGVVLEGNDLDVLLRPPHPTIQRWRLLSWAIWQVLFIGLVLTSAFAFKLSPTQVLISCVFLLLSTSGFCLASARAWTLAKRAHARSAAGQLAADIVLDADGLRLTSPMSTANFSWPSFEAVVDGPREIAFWISPMQAFVIPKRYIDDSTLVKLRRIVADARSSGVLAPS